MVQNRFDAVFSALRLRDDGVTLKHIQEELRHREDEKFRQNEELRDYSEDELSQIGMVFVRCCFE